MLASAVLTISQGPMRRRALDAVLAITGLVAGKVALTWWQAANGQDPMSRLGYVFEVGLHRYVISALGNAPALLFSNFSLIWPLVVVALVERWQHRRRVASAMVVAVLLAAGGDPVRA